jgi:hypothetical protein
VSRIRIQLDEDCQSGALAHALQLHGVDVRTTNSAGLTGISDEAQLTAASSAGRVLVTNNARDFVPLHNRWAIERREHGGIIVFPQQEFSIVSRLFENVPFWTR